MSFLSEWGVRGAYFWPTQKGRDRKKGTVVTVLADTVWLDPHKM